MLQHEIKVRLQSKETDFPILYENRECRLRPESFCPRCMFTDRWSVNTICVWKKLLTINKAWMESSFIRCTKTKRNIGILFWRYVCYESGLQINLQKKDAVMWEARFSNPTWMDVRQHAYIRQGQWFARGLSCGKDVRIPKQLQSLFCTAMTTWRIQNMFGL